MAARARSVVDPLEALSELERMAKRAQADLRQGRAVNGVSALRRIELGARDARRLASESRSTMRA